MQDQKSGVEVSDEAIDAFKRLGANLMVEYALNTKARLFLVLQRPDEALEVVNELLLLLDRPSIHLRPQEYWFSHYLTLNQLGRDKEAREALIRAYGWVKHIADTTEDEHLRSCWLNNIPDNGRILTEAEALGIAG